MLPNEDHDDPASLDRFVHGAAADVIDGGFVVAAVVVFEYIDTSGALKNGILHHNGLAKSDAISVVMSTARNLADQLEDDDDE